MVAVEGWTWWQSEQERKKREETENANSGVSFRRRKKERGGDEVGSAPCGLVCYRENETSKNISNIF